MKRFLLVTLAVTVIIGMLVSSCGGPAEAPAPEAPAGAPEPEGTFTFGAVTLSQEGFIPWQTLFQDALTFMPVYESLGIPDPVGNPLPCLAESWEWSEDYMTFTVHLREGVPWQGGWGEVTAEDVKYSFEQIMSDESVAAPADAMRRIIESMEVIDSHTLDIHYTEPNVDLIKDWMQINSHAPILCKEYLETVGLEEANLNPIGSGPYKLVEHEFGDYLKYEAVEDHWRVVPEFKYLIIKGVPEESIRVAMLKTGQIDACIINETSIAQLPEEDFTIDYWPGGSRSTIIFGGMCNPEDSRYIEGYHNQDPWADVRVREAMNIAIDREAINEALHLGTAWEVATTIQIPGWEEVEELYPYDPDRARQLLAEAAADGVFTPNAEGGFSFDLISSPYHPGVPLIAKEAEAVVGYWEQVGIHANIVPLDFMAYWPNFAACETAGECYTFRVAYAANPIERAWMFSLKYPTYNYHNSPYLTELAEEVLAEMDLAKRDPTYREMIKYYRDNYLGIGLFQSPFIMASNKHWVGDWPPCSTSYYYNFEYIRHAEPLNTFRLFELE